MCLPYFYIFANPSLIYLRQIFSIENPGTLMVPLPNIIVQNSFVYGSKEVHSEVDYDFVAIYDFKIQSLEISITPFFLKNECKN